MESSYNDEDIIRLHASFIEAMESDCNFSSFSEDDLIDIFDYSCSISDEFVLSEVIIVGERFFPNSQDLLKRKALMYHRFDKEDACIAILNRLPEDSFLNIVISAKKEQQISSWIEKLKKQLSAIKSGTIEDGDIIYAVDFFESIGQGDILLMTADELSRISEYHSTIYNELFHILLEKGRYQEAVEYGRKLIDIEPFNSLAWTELADLYNVNLNLPLEAIECADFALAINPKSIGALMVKSSAIYESNPDESRKIVDKIMALAPNDPMSFYARAILNINDGNRKEGINDILQSINLQPVSGLKELLELLFRNIDSPLSNGAENIIISILKYNDSIDAVKLCEDLISYGQFIGAYEVFRISYSIGKYDFAVQNSIYFAVEAMYQVGAYDKILELLDIGCHHSYERRLKMPLLLSLIYSLAWYHNYPSQRQSILSYLTERIAIHDENHLSSKILDKLVDESSYKRIILLIDELSLDKEIIDFKKINPFQS